MLYNCKAIEQKKNGTSENFFYLQGKNDILDMKKFLHTTKIKFAKENNMGT